MVSIKLLSDEVIDKIAAGEVIERPASIIKELLENALDANATRIEISFESGGINLLEVSDNGIGISKQELELAFKRHATSKINGINDLSNINTLGFRGEALPSIAAVSKVSTLSRVQEADEACLYKISGGKDTELEIAARAPGTTIRVEDIFFNLPVRKKFLKSETTERRNIISTVETLSLARPDIAFLLKSGGKKIFDYAPASLKERFLDVFGKKLSEKVISLKFENPFIKLSGFITKADISFLNRRKIYVFVNNRPVNSPLIFHAISQGYNSFIPSDRHPACLLNVSIKPELVDVNVHPTKKEVKFVNQHGVHEILSKVIRSELEKSSPKIDISISNRSYYPAERKFSYRPSAVTGFVRDEEKKIDNLKNVDLTRMTEFSFAGPKDTEEKRGEKPVGELVPRFQWKCKYIIAEDDKGILVIDQHTAWERINYERLKNQFKKQGVISQGTLIPEVLEFEPSQAELLLSTFEVLQKFGIYMEEFGPNTFKVTGIPSIAKEVKTEQQTYDMVENIINLFGETGDLPSIDELNDEILKIIACRSSIKAGDRMSGEEIQSMVKMLDKCSVPHRCPHGRPIIIRITESELDAKFLR